MLKMLRPLCILALAAQICPAFSQTGTVDDGFMPPVFAATDDIKGVLVQEDGSILVYGALAASNPGQLGLMRLQSNGQLDTDFQPQLPALSTVYRCVEHPSGGWLVSHAQGLSRLNADGSADPSLVLDASIGSFQFLDMAVQADGKILLGASSAGAFARIRRINVDGSLDPTFITGAGIEGLTGWVQSIAVQGDGKILIGGGMSGYQGVISESLCRLNPDASRDDTFLLTPGTESLGYGAYIAQLAILPDDKILTAGNFHTMNGVARHNMARLNSNGTLDASFDIGTGFTAPGPPSNNYESRVSSFAVQADGRILVAGRFTAFNGTPCQPLVRLNSDGTLDPSFTIGSVFTDRVRQIALQADGKVLAVGQTIGTPYYAPYNRLVRLENCFAGATCDDGLAYTESDVQNAACQCAGTPICVPSQLTSTADPLVSCGATGLRLDGTSALHATTVPGANKYQFRFVNVPGQPAYSRNITSPTRSLTLTTWATLPLKKGRSYRVTVRASFDNGASFCDVGGTCNISIANYSVMQRASEADGTLSDAGFTLFPVPYTSGPLMLHAQGLIADGPLQVRVLNATGQELVTSRYTAVGEEATLSLPTDRALVPGLYFVELSSGEQRLVQRLLVQ